MFPTFTKSEGIGSQAATALLERPRLGRRPGRAGPATRAGIRRRQPRLESLEDRCLLSDTVITFDDLAADTIVYQAKGVVFTGAPLPIVEVVPAGQEAQSGTQVASIFGSESVVPQVSGTFTDNLHQHVKVYVGEFEEAVPTSAQLTMKAYDAGGNLIAQSDPVTVYSGAGFHTALEVDSPTPNIASFEVTGRRPGPGEGDLGDLGKRLAIDDLTFDNPTVVQPDFSLLPATSVIEVGPGQSVSDGITISRYGGSTGDIQFAASGLPPGVTADFAPNPAGGASTTLTLTAALDALTTSTGSMTVTATPLVPGAGPATRAITLDVHVRPTVITFDDLSPYEIVAGQYQKQGVVFTGAYLPQVTPAPAEQAQSGTHVADIADGEFDTPQVSGTFTNNLHQHVKVYVGEFVEEGVPKSAQLTMRAYDASGNLIAQSDPVTVYSGAGFHTALEVDSPTPNIASFEVTGRRPGEGDLGDVGKRLAIDDLTFDNPTVVQPDFTLLPAASVIEVGPGQSVSDGITINRFGGSSGDIQFAASGLPQGVTAAFVPNPAGGASTISELTVTAAPDAPTTSTGSMTVTATPVVPGAGPATRAITLDVHVRPDFTVGPEGPTEVNLPYGWSITVPVTVTRQLAFRNPPIDLSVSGLPAGVTASFDTPTVGAPPGDIGLVNYVQLMLTAEAGERIPGYFVLDLEARNGLEASHASLTVHGIPVQITSFSPSDGWTPVALKPGTEVVLQGTGFSTGSLVQFGNRYAQVVPTSIAADGTELHVLVPRLATTGPLTVITPLGDTASSPTPFTVHSYRNTDGFAFHNFDLPGVSWGTVQTLFGYDQMHLGFKPLWPFSDFEIATPIPDPFAAVLVAIIDKSLTDGQCFGISLASQRLIRGQVSYNVFPIQSSATEPTVWNLDGPGGPSDPLYSYIHVLQVAQFSAEYIGAAEDSRTRYTFFGPDNLYMWISRFLIRGEFPLISMKNGSLLGGEGHTVVAYNLEPAADGFYIDVYDNNVQFQVAEDRNANLHRGAEGYTDDAGGDYGSRIHVFNDGHWEFPNLGWSNSLSKLLIVPPSSIPVRPTILTSVAGLEEIVVSGATQTVQVADAAGHTLVNPDGTDNTDPATRLPDAFVFYPDQGTAPSLPMILLGGSGPYTQTVRGTGTGPYDDTLLGYNFAAHVLDSAATQGIDDRLTLDAQAGSFQFQTDAASKPLTLQLLARAPDLSAHTAVINTDSFHNGSDRFTFDANREVLTYAHAGAGTDYTLSLSGVDPTGQQLVTFMSPTLHIGPGDTAIFQPSDWHRLNSGTVAMTIIHDDGRRETQILRNQAVPPPRVQGVVINDGSAQRSMVTSLTVTFDRLVTLDRDAFEVSKRGGGSVGLKVASSEVDGKTVAVLTFAGSDVIGGSLADGHYTLTVHGDKIHDLLGQALDGDANGTAGSDYVDAAISRLFGDADGDGDVDNSDAFSFKAAYSKSRGQEGYQPFFDLSGDGTIDTIDFAEMKKRYGKRI